jgi:hypothetical protein
VLVCSEWDTQCFIKVCGYPEGLDVCEWERAETVDGAGESDGVVVEKGWWDNESVQAERLLRRGWSLSRAETWIGVVCAAGVAGENGEEG